MMRELGRGEERGHRAYEDNALGCGGSVLRDNVTTEELSQPSRKPHSPRSGVAYRIFKNGKIRFLLIGKLFFF